MFVVFIELTYSLYIIGVQRKTIKVPKWFLFRERKLQLLINKHGNYVPCPAVLEEGVCF